MKMVNCYECKKELRFIDASPLWNRFDKDPDFLCAECGKDVPKLEDEHEIRKVITRKIIKDSQPESSKREDLMNSEEYKNASEIMKTEFRLAEHLRKILPIS